MINHTFKSLTGTIDRKDDVVKRSLKMLGVTPHQTHPGAIPGTLPGEVPGQRVQGKKFAEMESRHGKTTGKLEQTL